MNLQKELDRTIIGLFQGKNSAFLSSLFCSMRFAWNTGIPTARTNGLRLLWNPDWFLSLSIPMRITVLAHELWHVAFMHMLRCGAREHRRWNAACDYAINLMLKDHGYVFDNFPAGHERAGEVMGLLDEQYRDMSAEQIYDALEGQTIELPFGEDFEQPNEKAPDQKPSQEEINEILSVVLRATTVAKMSRSDPGTMPASFLEMIEELLHPQIPWTVQVQKWLTEKGEKGYNWARPNRRYQHCYLPSQGGEEGLSHILWAIDSSGSLSAAMLAAINTEIASAHELLNPDRMTVVTFDTAIQDVWEFEAGMEIPPLEIHGRGGTDMQPVFDLAKTLMPKAIFMFSDMECSYPEKIPGIDVCWVCLDCPDWVPPYGTVIHVDTNLSAGA